MKKATLVLTLIAMIAATFAFPVFASDTCDPSQDYLTIGREQADNGDFDAALVSANCGLSLDADSYELLMLRAMVYCSTNRIELAIADMTTAIEIRPDSAYAYNARGWANYRLGNLELSLSNLNTAIELDEELAYAYNNRGLVYQAMGEHALAQSDFETAIDLGLVEPWATINLYNLEFEMAKLEIGG